VRAEHRRIQGDHHSASGGRIWRFSHPIPPRSGFVQEESRREEEELRRREEEPRREEEEPRREEEELRRRQEELRRREEESRREEEELRREEEESRREEEELRRQEEESRRQEEELRREEEELRRREEESRREEEEPRREEEELRRQEEESRREEEEPRREEEEPRRRVGVLPRRIAVYLPRLMAAPWLSALASAIHLTSVAAGAACLLLRHEALRAEPLDDDRIRRVLAFDNGYGLAVLGIMTSGLWRLFGTVEKGGAFYTSSPMFWAKMGLFALGWGCEILPMLTFIRWRAARGRGQEVDVSRVPLIRRLHLAEALLVLCAIPAASLMSRGVGRSAAATTDRAGADLALGESVYLTRCSPCHQPDGHGLDGKVAADFVADTKRLAKSDADLLLSIEMGVPGTAMRGFGAELKEGERKAALAYIRKRFGKP
jgi:uncharacterized membrane protein